MPSPEPMRLLVVGLGSIGRRHLSCLRRMLPDARITVWRQHHAVADCAVPEGADRLVGDIDAALADKPQAAVICGPAPTHADTGLRLAAAGLHLLVEKPLADDLAGAERLHDSCARAGTTLMVGYVLRFHPVFQAMRRVLDAGTVGRVVSVRAEIGQYLPDWRPDSDYRQGVSARAALGGGALLELSHEIDIVVALLGVPRSASARLRRLGDLDIDVEDNVELILDYPGAVASLHMDMLQRAPHRTCRVVGTEGTIEADFIAQTVRVFAGGGWQESGVEKLADRDALYMAELNHFLDCVRTGALPAISGQDGVRVLRIIEAARVSDRESRAVAL